MCEVMKSAAVWFCLGSQILHEEKKKNSKRWNSNTGTAKEQQKLDVRHVRKRLKSRCSIQDKEGDHSPDSDLWMRFNHRWLIKSNILSSLLS